LVGRSSTSGHAVVGQTACRSWRPGIVVDAVRGVVEPHKIVYIPDRNELFVADGGDEADLLEEVFRDVVVVRGEHPVPPREILELRLPPEARQALEEQAAALGRMGRKAEAAAWR